MLLPGIKTLREDQQNILRDDARFKVVACGRRWGKTTLGLVAAIEAARQGQRVWWVAPSYHLAFHPWMALKQALYDEWDLKLERERHIELPGGGSITIKSAKDPDSLRGVGLDLVIVDEAAFVSEAAWVLALRPALSDRLGKALIISTPNGHNWFWHAYQRGNDPGYLEWKSWQAPASANPLIPDDEIDEARRTLPPRSFEQEYLAAFLPDSGMVFTGVRQAATAPADPAPQPQPGHRYLMGLDFGRYDDFTAAVVLDATTGEMVALDRFNELDWGMQRTRIAGLARRWRVETVLAEANAAGEPNIEALRRAGVPVLPFVTTPMSKPPLIERLVSAIQQIDVRLLPDEVLLGELEAYTYKKTAIGTYYSAPPGRHDDTVIALALAWWMATIPRLVFGIAEV